MIPWWASPDRVRAGALILLLIILQAQLGASTVYRSNVIGQQLEKAESASPYHLVVDGSQSSLYHREELLFREETRYSDGQSTRYRLWPDGREEITWFESDRPTVRQEGERTIYYFYSSDGRLEQINSYVGDVLEQALLYSYGGVHAMLSSVIEVGDFPSIRTYAPSGFSYLGQEGGETFIPIGSAGEWVHSYRYGDDIGEIAVQHHQAGGFVVVQGERTLTYNEQGLLIKEETPSLSVDYRYNEKRALMEEEQIDGDGVRTLITWEDGRHVMMKRMIGSTLIKRVQYLENGGRIETLFRNGVEYSDVTYAPDGVRILDISYR